MTGVLAEERRVPDTHRGRPSGDRGRNWSSAQTSPSRGLPAAPGGGTEAWHRCPLRAPGGPALLTPPLQISGLQSGERTFLLFESTWLVVV